MHLSIWEKESFYAPCDLLIAGSGFVGLWSAYYIKKKYPDLRITIVERSPIPSGASTRNAGFACFGSVTELMSDVSLIGEDETFRLVDMRFTGLQKIKKLFGKKDIDFELCGGYELIDAVPANRLSELQDQVEWLNGRLASITGGKRTYAFADRQVARFGFAGISHLIKTAQEGCLHPGKLCMRLQQQVQSMGVNILSATDVKSFESGSMGVELVTNRNAVLRATKLLVCTNAFARELLPALDVVPARGQVLLTAPIANLAIRGTFHFDEGYYYFRNLGNRLLLGGARNLAPEQEGTLHLAVTDNIQQKLEGFIRKHLLPGQSFEVTDRWSGIMGMGREKMPIVQQIDQNLYCAVRTGGMGVALAPVIGKQVAALIG